VESTMAMEALQPLGKEQIHSADLFRLERSLIATKPAIVGRIEGHDRAHEARECADDVEYRPGILVTGKGGRKRVGVVLVVAQASNDLPFPAGHAHFDRLLAEHGRQRLDL